MNRRFQQGQYGDKFNFPPPSDTKKQEEPKDWWQQPGFQEFVDQQQQKLVTPQASPSGPDFLTRWYYEPETKEITEEQTSYPLFYRAETRGLTTQRTSIPAVQSVMPHVAKDFDQRIFDAEIAEKDPRRGRGFDPETYKAAGIDTPKRALSATELHVLSGGTFEGGPDRITPQAIESIQDALMGPEVLRARAEAEVRLEDVRAEIAEHVVASTGPAGDLSFESDEYIDKMLTLNKKEREAEAEIKRFEDIENVVEETIPDLPVFLVQDDGRVMPRQIVQGNNLLEGNNPGASWFRQMRNANMDLSHNLPGWELILRGFRLGLQQIFSEFGKILSPISGVIAFNKYTDKPTADLGWMPPAPAQWGVDQSPRMDVIPLSLELEFEEMMDAGEELSLFDLARYNAKTVGQFISIEWAEEDEAVESYLIPYMEESARLKKLIKDGEILDWEAGKAFLKQAFTGEQQDYFDKMEVLSNEREQEWTAIPEQIQQEIDGQDQRQERFRTDFDVSEEWLAAGTEQARSDLQDLYRRKMELARTDARFNDYTFRYTEMIGPEGFSNFQDLVVVALADATLQKGRMLEPQEIERITEIYSNPVDEFIGEVTFDFFNVMPAKLVSSIFISPIKGAFKAPGKVLNALTRLDDPVKMWGKTAAARTWTATLARNVDDIFRANALASKGHQLVAKADEFFHNFARTTPDVAGFIDETKKLLSGGFEQADYSKFRVSARQVDHMLGRRGLVAALELGEPDDVIKLISNAADEVQAKKVQELLEARRAAGGIGKPTAQELNEIHQAAINYATHTENIIPTLSDSIFQKYMQEQAAMFRGGPLKDTLLAHVADSIGVETETTRSLLRHYLNFFGKVRGAWANCILTARPGFTVINFLDSTFRAIVHGGNIFDDIATLSKMVPYFPEEIPGGFMRAMVGELTDIGHMLISGKAPTSLAEVFAMTAKKGNGPLGKALAGIKGMNSYVETGLRMRVYAPLFAKEWPKVLEIMASRLDELGLLSNNLVRGVFDELVIAAPYHPERTVDLIDTLLTGKIDQSRPGITAFYNRDTYKALAEQIGGPRASVALNSVAQSMLDELKEFGVISDDAVRRIMNEAREEILTAEQATFKRQSEFINADGGFDAQPRPLEGYADDLETVEPQRPLDEISPLQEANLETTRAAVVGEQPIILARTEDTIADRVDEIVEGLKADGATAMPESGAAHFRANLERWREGGGDFVGSYRGLGVDVETRQALDEIAESLGMTENELADHLLIKQPDTIAFTGNPAFLENEIEVPGFARLDQEGLQQVGELGEATERLTLEEAIKEYNENTLLMESKDPEIKELWDTTHPDDRKLIIDRTEDLRKALLAQEFVETETVIASKLKGKGIKEGMAVKASSGVATEWGVGTVVEHNGSFFFEDEGVKFAWVDFGDVGRTSAYFGKTGRVDPSRAPRLVPINNLEQVSEEAIEAARILSAAERAPMGVPPAQVAFDEMADLGTKHPTPPSASMLNEGQTAIRPEWADFYTDYKNKRISFVEDLNADGEWLVYFADGRQARIPNAHLSTVVGVGDVEFVGAERLGHLIRETGEALPEEAIRATILHPERSIIDPKLADEAADSARVLRGELAGYTRETRPQWHKDLTQGPKLLSSKLTVAEADTALEEILRIVEEGLPIPDTLKIGDKTLTNKTLRRFIEGTVDDPERFSLSRLLTERMSEESPYTKYLLGGTDEEVAALLRKRGGQSLEEFLDEVTSTKIEREMRAKEIIGEALEDAGVGAEYTPDVVEPRPKTAIEKKIEKLQKEYDELSAKTVPQPDRVSQLEAERESLRKQLEALGPGAPEEQLQSVRDAMAKIDDELRPVPAEVAPRTAKELTKLENVGRRGRKGGLSPLYEIRNDAGTWVPAGGSEEDLLKVLDDLDGFAQRRGEKETFNNLVNEYGVAPHVGAADELARVTEELEELKKLREEFYMPETVLDDAIEPEGTKFEKKLDNEIEEIYDEGQIARIKERLGVGHEREGLAAWKEEIKGIVARHKEMGRNFAHSTRKFGDTLSFVSDLMARHKQSSVEFIIEGMGWTIEDLAKTQGYLGYLNDIQGITTGQGMFDFLSRQYLDLGAKDIPAAMRHGRFEMYYLIREHIGIWKSNLYDEVYDLVLAGKFDVVAKMFDDVKLASYEDVFTAGGFRFRYDGETLTGIGSVFHPEYKRNSPLMWDVRGKTLSDLQLQLGAIGKTELQAPIQRTGTYVDALYDNHGIPRTPRPTLRSQVKHLDKIVVTEDPRLLERGLNHVDEFGHPVLDDEIQDSAWEAVRGKTRTTEFGKNDSSLLTYHGRRKVSILDTPEDYFRFIDEEIKKAAKAGNHEKVKLLDWRRTQVQQDLNTMNAVYGVNTPRYLIPEEGMLPKGLRQFFAEGTATMDRQGAVQSAYDEMEEFLLGSKKEGRGLDSIFMQEHEIDSATEELLISLRDEMSRMQVEGIESVTYGTSHLPGGEWYGYKSEGAVAQTNRAMLNYNEFTPFDQFMKNNIFPFWMFPSRSLPMWVNAMAMHPEIATFYFRYMDLSERTMYRAGFITSDGRQLPSSRGYIRLPGTEGLAINFLSPLSFRYAIPDYDEYYDAFQHLLPEQQFMHRTINSLTQFGLTPSPILSMMAYGIGVLDENIRPKWSIIPQTAMVPPNWQRGIMSAMRKMGYKNAPDKWTPDVSWKTYLIEDAIRQNAHQQVMAISDYEEQMRIATAAESAVANKMNGSAEDQELWLSARAEFEHSELWRKIGGYFTGFYAKEFTDAQAEAILSRMNTNATAWAVNNLLGAEIMSMDMEAEKRQEFYRLGRYQTPEGYLHTLHNTISYVRTEAGDPAYNEERDEIVAQLITEEIADRTYWEEIEKLQEIRDTALAALPEGSPGFMRSDIYGAYYEGKGALDVINLYDPAQQPWYVGYKPARLLMEDIENVFFYTAMDALEPYDTEKEEYLDYKARKEEHVATELPLIVEGSEELWKKLDRIQYLDPSVNGVDAIGARLLEIANPEGYAEWNLEKMTLDDALFYVFEKYYLDEYFKEMDGKKDEEYDMAQRAFYNKWRDNPINKTDGMGPSEEHFLEWMHEELGDKFSDAEILKAINPIVYDVEDRLFAQRAHEKGEDFASAEDEAWDIYGSIPPGSQDEFRDEYQDAGGDERFLEALTNKDVEFIDAEALEKNMPAMREAQAVLGLTSRDDLPTEVLEERLQVRKDDDDYHAFVDQSTYPGFWEEYATYNRRSYAWQKTYRDTHEKFAEAMKLVPDLKIEWALTHPIWAEYYSVKTEATTSGGRGGRGGGGGYTSGSQAYSATTTSRPALRDIRFGKRSTMDASYLLKPGQLGKGGVTGKLVWPPKLKEAAGPDLVADVDDLMTDGTPLSESANNLLDNLKKKFPESDAFISEIEKMALYRAKTGTGVQEF